MTSGKGAVTYLAPVLHLWEAVIDSAEQWSTPSQASVGTRWVVRTDAMGEGARAVIGGWLLDTHKRQMGQIHGFLLMSI